MHNHVYIEQVICFQVANLVGDQWLGADRQTRHRVAISGGRHALRRLLVQDDARARSLHLVSEISGLSARVVLQRRRSFEQLVDSDNPVAHLHLVAVFSRGLLG